MTRPSASSKPPDRPILVVDDDRKIVALVRTYLEREGYQVDVAYDGRAALRAFRASPPALVVLDVMLPELDGLQFTRVVRESSEIPILMLSARGTVADRIRGLERGADDYLPKPFSPAELVARVRTILRRGTAPGPASPATAAPARIALSTPSDAPTPTGEATAGARLLRHADLTLDPDRHEVRQDGRLVALTNVEFRLLAALIAADGRVLSRDRLLDAVYGAGEGEVLDRTIDVHIRRLRDKLDDDPEHPRYVATVRGAGYRAAPAAAVPGASDRPSPRAARPDAAR
jgi:DNA-binding response OmpR family regulator